jgi:septal ring factor EnvC (AmiA/AmiB activator)
VPTVQIKADYKFVKPKPTRKEDIERCITSDDMTQTEIVESIMENWDVCRRTAYNLMKKYGLTRQYKKADEAAEDVAAVQQQASDIAEYSWKYTAAKYQKEVVEKDKEIAELKAEIERLKNLINR